MFRISALICVLIGLILCIIYFVNKERCIKKMLTYSYIIPLETVVSFSNSELIERLKKYYKKEPKRIHIEYADGMYVEINTKRSKTNLIKRLERTQEFMINKRYNPDPKYVVKDSIKKIMYDVWLDYAYKDNYKVIFWREIERKYAVGEISTHSYNEITKYFYRYKLFN